MTDFTSADLLARMKDTLQLGDNYEGSTDTSLYQLLSNGQRRVLAEIAAVCPWVNYPVPEQLTTADSGVTYTLAAYPVGPIELRDGRTGPILLPTADWDAGSDGYLFEAGSKTIRFPSNTTRTFTNGLWARYVPEPAALSATVEPTIKPPRATIAVVYDACAEWALQGGYKDPAPYRALRSLELWGDPNTGGVGLIPLLRQQESGMGGGAEGAWWRVGAWIQG